jgi:hypothetical protein
MVRFQKSIKMYLTLHEHNVYCQQRELSKFLMRYQQFASHAYCRAVGPVSKMASQQETVLKCSDLWLQCSVSFMDGLEKTHHTRIMYFVSNTKLTLHCNHRSWHLKTEHTEILLLQQRHLGNWSRGKHDKRTAGNTWETWTVPASDIV